MILWFSGTGNSREVAERLAAHLHEPMCELTPVRLSTLANMASEKRIIWVFPVYSWGVPPYVRKVIEAIGHEVISVDAVHHLVVTCGDDTGLTAQMWRKCIRKRGWKSGSAFSVQMPNNYVCMKGFDVDSAQIESEKLDAAPQRIKDAASMIVRSEESGEYVTDMVKGSFAWFKSKVIYPWFIRYAMSPKPFHYTKACISCGKCAAICPLDNIAMAIDPGTSTEPGVIRRHRRHPQWGDNCAGCLACYHVCPRHAVEYGKATIGKGQYLNPIIRMNKK